MPSSLFREWSSAWNKDELKFYDNYEFRRDYTRTEMDSKAKMFKQRALDDVRDVLKKIWSQTKRNDIRIVSLGCGPGSDLLGILGAVDSVLRCGDAGLGWEAGDLQCHCTGVDAFDWNRDAFTQRLNDLASTGVLGRTCCEFLHEDMESFALKCFHGNGRRKFDFICLSFADAGRNLELIGTVLPQLLTQFGRILVLDNDIKSVRSLDEYGYTCTFAANGVCMHSMGRGSRFNGACFPPSSNSPIRQYRLQKEAEERARLREQSRRQSATIQVSSSYNAYPYSSRESSWCEKNCSIL